MSKKTVAVLLGGRSSEHEISCLSTVNIIYNIGRKAYNLMLISITKKRHWVEVNRVGDIEDGNWREPKVGTVLSPDTTGQCLVIHEQTAITRMKIDLVLPMLHGLYGKNSTIQGLYKLVRIPFVDCGVAASAVGVDKSATKLVVHPLNIQQADFLLVTSRELGDMCAVTDRAKDRFSYPVFVKPCNAGSGCGVTKVHKREGLAKALREAARFNSRILIEEYTVGRETERAVLGGGARPVQASDVGEILAAADFYDYDAKYYDAESKTVMNPELPEGSAEEMHQSVIHIFNALDGYGLSRIDSFVTAAGEAIFNEINTMPGFTAISMYPILFTAHGKDKKTLIEGLVGLAFKREAWIDGGIFGEQDPVKLYVPERERRERFTIDVRAPIDVLDSGVGGLTVIRESMRQIPGRRMVYSGDTTRLPYGAKSRNTIIRFSRQIVRFLKTGSVKAVMVTCNTVSPHALKTLAEEDEIPVIEVVYTDALGAVRATKNRRIGVIDTRGTVNFGIYPKVIQSISPGIHVFQKAYPMFVPLVGGELLHDSVTDKMTTRYLQELKEEYVDTPVLGCTHYPLFRSTIGRVMGEKMALINPTCETATELRNIPAREKLLNPGDGNMEGKYRSYMSDLVENLRDFANSVLPTEHLEAKKVEVEEY